MTAHEFLEVAEEVRAALADGRPVVALESTIISHGMPYPENLEMARSVQSIVREAGATPAIIALADGRVRIGVDSGLLDRLAAGRAVAKVSRRDIAPTLARHTLGATTVASTMLAAGWAGIRIFATGGIGGVHRGASETFDISTDLTELAETAVAVVSAGAKSILDLAKTLEVLETHGVLVVGYRTDEFPAFFARTSGHRLDYRCDTPEAVAEILDTHFRLGLGGALIANPIPAADALPAAEIDDHIREAVREAEAAGIARKDVTPFLLERVKARTGGRSLAANIALAKNNAGVGAEIAVALARRARDAGGAARRKRA
jgi:pseudouridine-5'-phosphate glycosidase